MGRQVLHVLLVFIVIAEVYQISMIILRSKGTMGTYDIKMLNVYDYTSAGRTQYFPHCSGMQILNMYIITIKYTFMYVMFTCLQNTDYKTVIIYIYLIYIY